MGRTFLLEVLFLGRASQQATVPAGGMAVGRGAENDLVLSHPAVSNRHLRLSPRGDQLELEDLNSTSGTFVNGTKTRGQRLDPGDTVQLGPFTILLKVREKGPTAEPAKVSAPAVAIPISESSLSKLLQLAEIVGMTDVQSLLEGLLERSRLLLEADKGLVVLVRRGRLSPVLAQSGSTQDEAFSRTVCERALVEGKSVVLDAGTGPATFGDIPSLAANQPGLVAAVPLTTDDKVLGVLYLERSDLFAAPIPHLDSILERVSQIGGRALEMAMEREQLLAERDSFRWATAEDELPDPFRTAQSARMREVLDVLTRAAAEDVTVLLRGETGTGKDILARTLHRMSERREGPFVAINCAAIPRDLMEAELFGHQEGSFTGASSTRPGRLETAAGGTLMLDEIGDLPRDLQTKLLRVLETRSFERVGGRQSIPWDARLVAATHRKLEELVASGEFREDLYFRINVVTVRVPPLRDRPEDLGLLVEALLAAANRRFRRKLYGIDTEALMALRAYRWPGNVRELKNVIDRAFFLESSERLTRGSVILEETPGSVLPSQTPPVADDPTQSLDAFVREQEREYIKKVLSRTQNNLTQAAKILGMTRSGLYRKMITLSLRPPAGEAAED